MLGQHCLLAEGDIGAPILVKGLCSVRLTYFHANAYQLGFTNRKRKYFKEKTRTRLKSKQTSIATAQYHLRTLASFSTPLFFHWSPPTTIFTTVSFFEMSTVGRLKILYSPAYLPVQWEISRYSFFVTRTWLLATFTWSAVVVDVRPIGQSYYFKQIQKRALKNYDKTNTIQGNIITM
jgi:hypothetical protein